jgi:hypothetical protein
MNSKPLAPLPDERRKGVEWRAGTEVVSYNLTLRQYSPIGEGWDEHIKHDISRLQVERGTPPRSNSVITSFSSKFLVRIS